jgi:hypothetical protein
LDDTGAAFGHCQCAPAGTDANAAAADYYCGARYLRRAGGDAASPSDTAASTVEDCSAGVEPGWTGATRGDCCSFYSCRWCRTVSYTTETARGTTSAGDDRRAGPRAGGAGFGTAEGSCVNRRYRGRRDYNAAIRCAF